MRLIIVLALCIISCSAEYYNLPKDDLTAAELRNNKVELKRRVDCFLEKIPCTSELLLAYKKIIPETLETACAKCSPEFIAIVKAFAEGVKEKYPVEYKELILKYDTKLDKYNKLERSIGVLETIFSSLPSLPSTRSLSS